MAYKLQSRQTERKSNPKKCALLIWGVPRRLKAQFKSVCALRRIHMKTVVINCMKDMVSGRM